MNEQTDTLETVILGALIEAIKSNNPKTVKKFIGIVDEFGITTEYFSSTINRILFSAMRKEYDSSGEIHYSRFVNRLAEQGFGDVPAGKCETEGDFRASCSSLQRCRICMLTSEEIKDVTNGMSPDNIELHLEKIKSICDQKAKQMTFAAQSDIFHVGDVRDKICERYTKLTEEKYIKGNKDFIDGVPLPWAFLNNYYGGLKTGLHVIAAAPSVGKSTAGLNISLFLMENSIPHGFVCIDMAKEALIERLGSITSRVSLQRLRNGAPPDVLHRYCDAIHAINDSIEITEASDSSRLRAIIMSQVRNHGWQTVIIDYLQLITSSEVKRSLGALKRHEQVARVTLELKELSKELKIPIICLVQATRNFVSESRETNRIPELDDLGDSSEIGRAAATVAFLAVDKIVEKQWQTEPPYNLVHYDPEEKFKGQNPLAKHAAVTVKSLRPVWFHIIKNQQGARASIPFIMYCNYFLMRPGDPDAPTEWTEINNKRCKNDIKKFSTIRDDWRYEEYDPILEATGAMGHRGMVDERRTYGQTTLANAVQIGKYMPSNESVPTAGLQPRSRENAKVENHAIVMTIQSPAGIIEDSNISEDEMSIDDIMAEESTR